ncbi:Peptidase S8/S53 subtilisin kexin sedolisin [Ignavibacterium album JCM 16511]|uniref:Peptidase S8/S53 subtilisin kexin sedolisin n=1 Tax=Ignavibacterium album (strain DSM 19864 / JCM 16511 / NBRC 101810 / Mat9-16) TaxID=945713 RepID=I0AM13_IGNAJ|nr:T9SS type A sorting domain-containing protein [Ignavibacterium album]AFH50020.1 Peptidase S8/S53 subtilisin kexin sedolisin [Ignavibacterium album JCM 16511]
MKKILTTIALVNFFLSISIFSQTIPALPTPASYAAAEVWGDSIYFFGGSNDFSGTELYKRIYKYNGTSWSYYDTIPFDHVWGFESAIKGDSVFLFGGWPSGAGKFYLYRLSTKTWTQLANGPLVFSNYGHTMEFLNGYVYAFYNGSAARYDPSTNGWVNLTSANNSASFSSSTVYNNEIYITGWSLSLFYKYNPTSNTWTQLADLPEFVSGGSLRAIDNNIYLVGGSTGFSNGTLLKIYKYDVSTNQWTLYGQTISSKRAYMEDVLYKNKFYILGGMNENFQAVNTVEFVMNQTTDVDDNNVIPTDFVLEQNYPNPFNPSTKITFVVPNVGSGLALTVLKVYDILGNEVTTLVNEEKPAGVYEVEFNAGNLSSGFYFYELQAGNFLQTKKMILIK